jgi:hypothetical protein
MTIADGTVAATQSHIPPLGNHPSVAELQHTAVPGEENGKGEHHLFPNIRRMLLRSPEKKGQKQHPLDWGMPGELTAEECDVYVSPMSTLDPAGFRFSAVSQASRETSQSCLW